MVGTFFSASRQQSLVSCVILAVVSSGSALFGCSGTSDEFDDGSRGGGSNSGGSNSGGSNSGGSSSGGNAGTAQGGNAGANEGGDAGSSGSRMTGGTGGTDEMDACVSTTCEAQGKNCGRIDDGCGRVLECGSCADGCTCGETVDNVCSGDGLGMSATKHGQRGRSSGFSGTDAQYYEIIDVPCASVDDCIDPCAMRGGTDEMCAATDCSDSTPDYCLPATVWRNTMALRSEGTKITDGAELVLVFNPYVDFLLVDDFKLEIPEAAEILGITVTIRRAGGGPNEAVDGAVRLIKGGVTGETDRSLPTPWGGPTFEDVAYGGPEDLWGETWTAADVNSPEFGVALSALYTDTAGNGRAYVDIVYVTVDYATSCELTTPRVRDAL